MKIGKISNKEIQQKIQERIYQLPKHLKSKLLVLAPVFFLLGLWLNFSLRQTIRHSIYEMVVNNRACPISFQKLELGILIPNVRLVKPLIPGSCLQNPDLNLRLDEIKMGSSFFSVIPPALKFHALIQGMGSTLKLFPRLRWNQVDVRITQSFISGQTISSLTPFPELLQGNISIDSLVNIPLKGSMPDINALKSDIKATGQNLIIPGQRISVGPLPFDVPKIEFAGLNFLASYNRSELQIRSLELGKVEGDLHLQLKGKIRVNRRNIKLSTLELEGRFRIGANILDKLAAIKLLLPQGKSETEYYNLELKGTFARPVPRLY